MFLDNMLHNSSPAGRVKILKILREMEAAAGSDHAASWRNLHVALGKWYDIHTRSSHPESLRVADVWDALRTAWAEGGYWFSVRELQFIMAVTATPCRILYFCEWDFRVVGQIGSVGEGCTSGRESETRCV